MMYRQLLAILFIFLSNASFAQIDKEFWFAAPYVNPTNGRVPVYIRFQSFDAAATITVDIPAKSSFTPIQIQLAANSAYSLDISSWLNQIENEQTNVALPNGLHIVSTNEIYIYYEVYGASSYAPGTNSDLFAFKGRNALGTEFYTPFQTRFDNYPGINARATFDIVATEDNTHITITPTTPIIGHIPLVPFTITLNKGETWSCQAFYIEAINRPTGSHISSDKPIGVTVKDDSMFKGNNWDLGGDQLIPVSQLGTEYIVIRHILNTQTGNDFAYILATEDNTEIFTKGNPTPITTLNKGAQVEIEILETMYITSSKPIYVLHVTGFGDELAEAILPQINCTGSKEVGFIRSNDENLVLNILTRSGSEGSFVLNGSTTFVKATDFSVVPGSSNWLFASIEYSDTQIPALKANLLKNTSGYFHLGLMNGLPDKTGFRYGYFSDFGFTKLGSDTIICSNSSIELSAGIQKDSYLWSPNGETTAKIFTQDSGTYSVIVKKENCPFKDTIHIGFFPPSGSIIVNDDDSICRNTSLTIKTYPDFSNFNWSNGATTDSIVVSNQNTYKITATDMYGCTVKDSVQISILPLPHGTINHLPGDEKLFCSTTQIDLIAPSNYSRYEWFDGSFNQHLQTVKTEDGMYWVRLTDSLGCINKISTEIDCSIYIEVYNLITPNGDGMNDFFEIKDLQKNTYALKIYNSWGALVYSNDNYNNDWTTDPLEYGVYYFSLTHHKNKKNFKGWLHVLH
ncbi:gliding motility-associated C-terminal domain-containing protein [Cytophaga aurantiaca]|uniref:gliding motility-associated C-terminal domain-containing protein n=1 Tax=Cytophaga aurantiaca TaxID=29530 RepID=UPI00038208B3|nr:gliding motility-associated C-terminal domain-containing protein [Cytophaga aurantiaca]